MHSQITSVLFASLVLAKFSVSNLIHVREPACSAAVNSLATGISENINVQYHELKLATKLSKILGVSPTNETEFNSTTVSLLTTVKKGITVREKNQAIAPPGNDAIPGLATVATAQEEELSLAQSIGAGGVDVSRDNATVTKLIGDFHGGIDQNKKNLAAATTGCEVAVASNGTTPHGTASSGTSPSGTSPSGTAPSGTASKGNAVFGNAPKDAADDAE